MIKVTALANRRLVVDPAAAADLRRTLQHDPQAGVQQAARQFEGMLLHLMLKSMREATASSGLFDSEQSRFFTALGDQQMAQELSSQLPLGFAGLIEKQMARQINGAPSATASATASAPLAGLQRSLLAQYVAKLPATNAAAAAPRPAAEPAAAATEAAAGASAGRRAYVDRVWPHAVEAAARTGVPAHFLVAQSALESGWGKRELRAADGSPSFNLFGIKAGRRWEGSTVEAPTVEFVKGAAQPVRAKFRAYGSYGEAFHDYARLLSSNPRFAGVIGQQDGVQFARSLQQAGYATDPLYADKLARIIGGTTLRQALAAA